MIKIILDNITETVGFTFSKEDNITETATPIIFC